MKFFDRHLNDYKARFAVRRIVVLSLLALLIGLSDSARSQSAPPDLWIAPLQPLVRDDGQQAGAVDYFSLFEHGAPWEEIAQHTTVFKIYPELVRSAKDDQLRMLLAGLRERHIALSLETKILTRSGSCVSGADHNPWMVGLVKRLKGLGAELQSVSMVGPLVDGHVSTGPGACHYPISDVAADAARSVAMMREIYPDLIVGEIEPVGGGPGFPTASQLGEWFTAFQRFSGKPVAFLHVDTVWGTPWHDDMRAIAKQATASGVAFGVIYKADPTELSDAAFASSTLESADLVEAVLGGPPQQVVFQSWEDYPRHALPDTDMTTLTGIARAYLRLHTQLSSPVSGRILLTDQGGQPISGADIAVEMHQPDDKPVLVPQVIEGVVPHSATKALFALRIHAECDCTSQPVAMALAGFRFRQPDVSNEFTWDIRGWGSAGGSRDGPIIRIDAAAGQKLILNGPTFPVSADRKFVAQFDWQVPQGDEHTGSAALIFLSASDNEVRRTGYPLRPTWQIVATLHTGPDGFAILPPLDKGLGASYRARYVGDLSRRPAFLSLLSE